jgi:biopolymer transport protein ExbD
VTITADGQSYFGIDAVTSDRLAKEMKSRPRNREQKLYIKADAETPYANVKRVLEAGREAAFDALVLLTTQNALVLLTTQKETAPAGTVVPPRGLEVLVARSSPSGALFNPRFTVVRALTSKQLWPVLKIDDERVPWSELQSMLTLILQNRSDKTILVKADGQLPYGQVVRVIDECHAAGGQIALAVPEL